MSYKIKVILTILAITIFACLFIASLEYKPWNIVINNKLDSFNKAMNPNLEYNISMYRITMDNGVWVYCKEYETVNNVVIVHEWYTSKSLYWNPEKITGMYVISSNYYIQPVIISSLPKEP